MQLIRNQNSLRTSYRRTEHVRVSTLEIQPIVHYMSSKYDSIYVMEYMYTGLTFRFIHCYIALWRVRQEQMTTTRYRYGFGTLQLPTFVARRLYVRKNARDLTGKRWNFFIEKSDR